MSSIATACGKVILSGEYAVVFGHRGIALPALDKTITVTFEEMLTAGSLSLHSIAVDSNHPKWESYMARIVSLCEAKSQENFFGKLTITGNLPVGKGMGSSTALVIATCKCLLGSNVDEVFCKSVENTVNPGNSGLDFAVIWNHAGVIFKKGESTQHCPLARDVLEGTELIDTGMPEQTTPELVAWIKDRAEEKEIKEALETIGQCTERILAGEDLKTVIKDHHRAQVALGVVPEAVQELIRDIEAKGGAAKVLGAGTRTGGGGMVLQIP